MRRSATHARQGNSRMLYSFYSLYREDDSIDWLRKVKRITEEYGRPIWTPNFSIRRNICNDGKKRKIDKCTSSFTFSNFKEEFYEEREQGEWVSARWK